MKIKEIELHNMYQHRSLSVRATGGVIGVVGRNGAGKSNFLESIGESFHGEFHQDKSRIVSWGEDNGFSRILAELSDGTEFEITRKFPSGAATIICGEEKVTGPNKVNAWILNKLQTDKGILEHMVFVGQSKIDAILFSRPTEKERLAQKFFSLGGTSAIETAITKSLAGIGFDSMAGRLGGLEQDVTRLLIDLSDARAVLDKMEESSDLESRVAVLDNRVAEASKTNATISTINALRPSLLALEKDSVALESQYRERYSRFEKNSSTDGEAKLAIHQKARDQKSRNEEAQRGLVWVRERQRLFAAKPHSDESVLSTSSRLSEVRGEISWRRSELAEVTKMLSSIGTESVCKTCGGPIDVSSRPPLEGRERKLRAEIQVLQTELAPLEKSIDLMNRELAAWNSSIAGMQGQESQFLAVIATNPLPDFDPDPERYLREIEERKNEVTWLQNAYAEMTKIRSQREASADGMRRLVDSLPGGSMEPVDVSALQAEVAELRRKIKEISVAEEGVRSVQARLGQTRKLVADAKRAESSNRAAAHTRLVLERVRAVFHPSGAPKTLITRSTKLLESRINHYLEVMGAAFTVVATEGLNFDAIFSDGVAKDSELSVGQKAALAWSFRLAGCETFSSSVGMMTMDEPSATMDKEIVEGFLRVIGIMKELASSHGMQFFVATHSDPIMRECDQIISV